MQAMAISSFGSPDVLQLVDVDDPQAGAGQVRVRVKTAGVQPIDAGVRRGWTVAGATVSLPQILGNEFSGTVDQVGDGVTDVSVGSEVLGFTTLGCYAELVVVSAEQIVLKPKDMPWEVAGGLSGAGQAAHAALKLLGVGKGDTVLIHAAAGGVGTVAVQVAREWGATVIGTASAGNHDYLRSLGAIPVTYGDCLVDRVRGLAPDGVDAALDAAGADALRASLELVKDRRRIGTLVEHELAARLGARGLRGQRSAARLAELVDMWTQGKLHIQVSKVFPLRQAADAHREIETRHVRGKVVLAVDEAAVDHLCVSCW